MRDKELLREVKQLIEVALEIMHDVKGNFWREADQDQFLQVHMAEKALHQAISALQQPLLPWPVSAIPAIRRVDAS